ncbi:MAG: c-type cytochrome [Gammaproteobacteria bacterium]
MNKKTWIFGILLALFITPAVPAAGDAAAGKAKSAKCATCHGASGIAPGSNPNLAGQKEAYLAKAMKDYRDGRRKDPMMSMMMKGLSDSDIADLAAYFAAQKP